MAGATQTTAGQPIKTASPDRVVLYAPDGTARDYWPVDVREVLASDCGYSVDPPPRAKAEQSNASNAVNQSQNGKEKPQEIPQVKIPQVGPQDVAAAPKPEVQTRATFAAARKTG